MDRGAWRAAVDGVAKSRTRLKRLSVRAFPTPSVYLTAITVQDVAPKSTPSMLELLKVKILLGLLTQEKVTFTSSGPYQGH